MTLKQYYLLSLQGKQFNAAPATNNWTTALLDTTTPFMGVLLYVAFSNSAEALWSYQEVVKYLKAGVTVKVSPGAGVESQVLACRYSANKADDHVISINPNPLASPDLLCSL